MASPYQAFELEAKAGTCSLSATENSSRLSSMYGVHWEAILERHLCGYGSEIVFASVLAVAPFVIQRGTLTLLGVIAMSKAKN